MNHFHAAGGIAFLVHTLLRAGLLHDDVQTVAGHGLWRYTTEPVLRGDELDLGGGAEAEPRPRRAAPGRRPVRRRRRAADAAPARSARAVIKTSAVKPEHRVVTAPAVVFDDQADFLAAFGAGELDGRDFVAVIRYQGPAANGMPELHKLTPALGVLQDRGQRVAIVTDGRMSGASGKVPAAIHVTPEAALGGPLARVRDGDVDHRRRRRRPARPARRPGASSHARAGTGRAPQGARVGRHRPRAVRRLPGHRRPGRHRRQRLPGRHRAPPQEVPVVQASS